MVGPDRGCEAGVQGGGRSRVPALDSIAVHNFGGLDDLSIGALRGVNLIVGRNNVGKTSLLEAVRIWATRGAARTLRDILESRGVASGKPPLTGTAVEVLFSRSAVEGGVRELSIGPVGRADARVVVSLGWTASKEAADGTLRRVVIRDPGTVVGSGDVEECLIVRAFGGPPSLLPLDRLRTSARIWERHESRETTRAIPATFVSANGVADDAIGPLWDAVALTDAETEVLAGMSIIMPDLERLTLVGDAPPMRPRVTMAKIRRYALPVPLKSLGAGVNRMLGITLGLVNARGGVALIDEIENGIHYSVQVEMWRLILSMSRRLDVQVFATSHSWDCVKAFEQATAADADADGLLLRVEARNGTIRSVPFDSEGTFDRGAA